MNNYPVWNIASKVCTKCQTGYNGDLSLHFHKSTRDGWQSTCKNCKKELSKQTHKEKMKLPENTYITRAEFDDLATYTGSYVTRAEFDALTEKLRFVIELVGKDKVEDLQKRWQLKVNKYKITNMSAQEFTNAREVCKPALQKIVNDPRAALTTEEEDLLIYEGWHDRDFG